jgi:hypothetical protein
MAEEELVDEVSQELKEDVSAEVRIVFTCLTLSVFFFLCVHFEIQKGF